MSYSADLTTPRQALDIGRCVNDAIEVYKQNWLILALAALVFNLLSVISVSLLIGPLSGGICLMLLRAYEREDKKVDFSDMFDFFDKFASLLGVFYLTLISVVFATLFCVIPGVLLETIWFYVFYVIVDEDKGAFDSLRTSKEIVMRKGLGPNLLVLAIVWAVQLVPSMIPYVGIIILWIVTPIAWLIQTSAYIQMVHEDDGQLDDLFEPVPEVL